MLSSEVHFPESEVDFHVVLGGIGFLLPVYSIINLDRYLVF